MQQYLYQVYNPVYSCLILSDPVCLSVPVCSWYRIKKEKRRKVEERKGENKGWHLKNSFISPVFLLYFSCISPVFLLYFSFMHFFISLDLLYFRSQSCNGFTPLCFFIYFHIIFRKKTQVCKLICLRTENNFLDLKEISPV